jgi:hypothetical protein
MLGRLFGPGFAHGFVGGNVRQSIVVSSMMLALILELGS